MISALVAKEVEKPLFAPEALGTGGCAVFLAPSPRVMIADGVKALDVCGLYSAIIVSFSF